MTATVGESIVRVVGSQLVLAEPQRLVWPPPWVGHIPFAFWLIENFRPRSFVELGAHSGNSYCAFLQAAVACELPIQAYAVDSWGGDPQAGYYGDDVFNDLSAYHDRLYGGISHLLRMTFDQALDYFSEGSIDLLHIDGLHTYDAVKRDFENWLPKMSDGGLVLFHDIAVRERDFGVWKLWEEVSTKYPSFAFDHSNGLGVVYVGDAPLPECLCWLMNEVGYDALETAKVRQLFARLGAGYFDRCWSEERARLIGIDRDTLAERARQIDALRADLDSKAEEATALGAALVDREERLHTTEEALRRLDKRLLAVQRSLFSGIRERLIRPFEGIRRSPGKTAFIARVFSKALRRAIRHPKKVPGWLASGFRCLRQQGRRGLWYELLRANFPKGGDRHLDPGALFDRAWYLDQNPDVRLADINPWVHFLAHGVAEGRNPNRLFDCAWYLRCYPDVRMTGQNPLVHYMLFGVAEGRDPSPAFDTDWYLAQYPDVRAAGADPLIHYLYHGEAEGRSAKPGDADVWPLKDPLPPYEAWMAVNQLSRADVTDLQALLASRVGQSPKISLITPIYNTPPTLFEELIVSVLGQIYDDWELCLADDCSSAPHVSAMLAEAAKRDPRIKVTRLDHNGGISFATNAAVEMASGDVLAFLDHDDLITPDCLAELALYYAAHPTADIVYSDDDKIDMDGRRYAPAFKPDWAPVLLLSFMYLGHIFSVRRSLFLELGGFRQEFDGSQDYDFALRAVEQARHIGHIPKILYHWRAAPGSTALSGDTKPASMEAGRLAVEKAMNRRGFADVEVIHPNWAAAARCGMFEIRFPDVGPTVTLVIPTRNKIDILKTCIDSLRLTTYKNYDILVVDNESDDPSAIAYLRSLGLRDRVRVVRIANGAGRFNYADINNRAVAEHCSGDYVLFLNNDTQIITPSWLSQMVGYARMPGVGAVGARLYFEDGTIQHAGVVHGYHEGLVGHAFRNLRPHDWGYLGFVQTSREYSGVTAACMLTPRQLFMELGGFDKANFAVAYNDVDYCYRLIQNNRTCIYCSTAELFHFEGKTRGFSDNPLERANFRRLYGDWQDRWYNPNLSLENERFEPAPVRPEARRSEPIQCVMVTHNLNCEGAPLVLLDLTVGLVKRGEIVACVVSPCDGPLRADYEAAGIPVHVMLQRPLDAARDEPSLARANQVLGEWLQSLGANVVVANTLQTFWAISAASQVGLPSLWCQHESEPWEGYFSYLPPALARAAYGAFAQAYRVLYVAEATRRGWSPLDSRRNFQVIRHGIPQARIDEEVSRYSRQEARQQLKIEADDIVLEIVGTISRRKGQLDMIKALLLMSVPAKRRLRVYIVGGVGESDYFDEIISLIADLPSNMSERVVLVGATRDPFLYYAAADVAVCTSLVESAPRVLIEAMAMGLPIVTTPVYGIPELVQENENALFYPAGDAKALADRLAMLIENDELRVRLASTSRAVLMGAPGFAEMVVAYEKLLRQAVNFDCRGSGAEKFETDAAQRVTS